MSGHSKWSTIKRQKGITDAARGKVFTRHSKNIEVAARAGGDPKMNFALASAIELARADNLPKDNIERAIKKGTGELEGAVTVEKIYEGYAAGGVALMISTLTDNPNRTVANVRHLLTKFGGKLAESGAVAFQFEKRGVLVAPFTGDPETVELAAIDAGAADTEIAEGILIVKTVPTDLMSVRQKLVDAGFKIQSAELVFEPTTEVKIDDPAAARSILKLMDALEEDEDVDSVSANFDIPDELVFGD